MTTRILSHEDVTFRNRTDAARQLAGHLTDLAGPDALVLAIPRGGVVVGAAIASELQCELDVIIVRKLGAPLNPELAIGSIMQGAAEPYLNDQIVRSLSVPGSYINEEVERQRKEAERRADRYRNGKPPARVKDRTVLLTDDGVATGATMISSIRGVKAQQPERLIVALPVGPEDTIEQIGTLVDDVVCLACPPFFGAVGQFYVDFAQTSDEEVVELLEKFEKMRK